MACMVFVASLFYVIAPCTDMRKEPKLDSEIVSQAYFSESVEVLGESEEWAEIRTTIDGYKGWAKKQAICEAAPKFLANQSKTIVKVNRLQAYLYGHRETVFGPVIVLPFESRLEVIDPDEELPDRWIRVCLPNGFEGYVQRGDVIVDPKILTKEEMCKLSQLFSGLPYTWGGRSSFGYDSSGFVQMLYRQMDIFLPRDSKDQMKWDGFREIEEKDLAPGDLIFFGLAPDKICGVGISLGNDLFIHATTANNQPWIRNSSLSTPEWNGSGKYCFRAFYTLK